ncbi:MAG: hypothetical protein A2096_01425 [Spirochaetes bacterium GWF1_41_5]|nr:MAG: hypothetical protein A2096_01425 [Spirochaetes bacterium GWF1_41_5]
MIVIRPPGLMLVPQSSDIVRARSIPLQQEKTLHLRSAKRAKSLLLGIKAKLTDESYILYKEESS